MTHITTEAGGSRGGAALRLILFSLIGIFLFFVPVEITASRRSCSTMRQPPYRPMRGRWRSASYCC